jgi:hypothetical protein
VDIQLLPVAILFWSAAGVLAAPKMDLAPFARLTSWPDGSEVRRFADLQTAGLAAGKDIGLEWREERDIYELRLQWLGEAPKGLRVQYWWHTWPGTPPQMPTVEDPADDPYQGRWLTALTSGECRAGNCGFTFLPLAPAENSLAKNLPGVRYRRSLKLRVVAESPLPPLTSFSAYSDAVERPVRIRVYLGQAGGHIDADNGRVLFQRTLGVGSGDSAPTAKECIEADVVATSHSLPGSLDCTLVTVHSTAGGEDRTFTFNVDDLENGPIRVPSSNAYVVDALKPHFWGASPAGKGPQIRKLIPKEPEQSYERAAREIPPLDPWQDQYGHRIYMPLAPDSSWQKFAFEYGGNVFIDRGQPDALWASGTKAMGNEKRRLKWDGTRITWKIGTGATPYYREDRKAAVALEKGYLPVITQSWDNDGLRYSEEAFATLLRGPLSPRDPARSEQTPAVLMLRVQADNPANEPRPAHVWLSISPEEKLATSGSRLQATGDAKGAYPAPIVRAVFDESAAPALEQLPGGKGRALHFTFVVPAHSTQGILLKLPFVSDITASDGVELARLDYDSERARTLAYWQQCVDTPGRITTPETKLNDLLRALIWHIGMSTAKDPVTGLYMVPAASYDYQVYANEACYQALLLDALGDHRTAAEYFETFLRLQGSRSFPGMHRGMEDAIFHGVKVNDLYDYTASTYGLDHPVVLWALGEHYLYARDRTWLLHAWPHMEKAIAWIDTQRASTRRLDLDGTRVRGYGLMPASSLEDNSDWAQWFSTNSFAWAGYDRAATALADIGHPEAARIRREADEYLVELRAAITRAIKETPVTRMRDGSYAPNVPIEPNLRFRRFGPQRAAYYQRYGVEGVPMLRLAATREVLYGPIILLNLGVFGVRDPIADWILDDWEDNVTLTSGLGMNVHGNTDDRLWFSQGGMVFQANLQNPIFAYLKRQETEAAIRGVFNNFAACLYPEAVAFTEEFRTWSHASGPFYKIPDEAKFANRIRDMLALEDGDTLYLGAGVPRRWLQSTAGVHAERLGTYFGEVSLDLHAAAEPGVIEGSVRLPEVRRPRTVWLVVRTPTGTIQEVTLNGKTWTRCDASREAIELPLLEGPVSVRVRYR